MLRSETCSFLSAQGPLQRMNRADARTYEQVVFRPLPLGLVLVGPSHEHADFSSCATSACSIKIAATSAPLCNHVAPRQQHRFSLCQSCLLKPYHGCTLGRPDTSSQAATALDPCFFQICGSSTHPCIHPYIYPYIRPYSPPYIHRCTCCSSRQYFCFVRVRAV